MVELLAALRGGITHAAVRQLSPGSAESSPSHPSDPTEVRSMGIAPTSTQFGSIPFSRRVGRRCLQLIRPLALPFLVRLKRWISLGVDESRSAALLRELLARSDDMGMRVERMLSEQRDVNARLESVAVASDVLQQSADVLQQSMRDQSLQIERLFSAPIVSDVRMRTVEHSIEALKGTVGGLATDIEKTKELAAIAAEYSSKLLQVRALPLGDEVLARSPFGWLLLPASDLPLVTVVLETGGLLEPGTAMVVQALLGPNDFAVDVGANVGALTLAMARSVAPEGRVIAIEPTPRTAALLRRTSAMSGFDDIIQVEECAAGQANGKALLSIAATSGHNSLLPLEKTVGSVEVQVRALDEMLPDGALPALVKIDVEGYELEVWRGMERLVREASNLAVVAEFCPSHLRRSGVTIEAWLAALTAPGFTAWEIDEASEVIRPLRSSGLENVFSINVLLLRKPPTHWPRLRIAA